MRDLITKDKNECRTRPLPLANKMKMNAKITEKNALEILACIQFFVRYSFLYRAVLQGSNSKSGHKIPCTKRNDLPFGYLLHFMTNFNREDKKYLYFTKFQRQSARKHNNYFIYSDS